MSEIEFRSMSAKSEDAAWCLDRYLDELGRRFPDSFDPCNISVPLDPAEVTPPRGVFVVVYSDERAIGCGAVRTLEPGVGEIKRMWLDDSVRGNGLGRRLLTELECRASAVGNGCVRLDTNGALTEAVSLYRAAGYREIEPYNENNDAELWFEKCVD